VRKGYHFREAEVFHPLILAEIGPEGGLNLKRLVKPAPGPRSPREPLREIPRISVELMGMEQADLVFRDESLPEPFEIALRDLTARLDGFDTNPENDSPLRLTATTPEGASLAWEGTVRADPLSARGTASLSNIHLPRYMPYGLAYTEGRLAGGRLALQVSYELGPAAVPRVATMEISSATIEDLDIEYAGEDWLTVPLVSLASARLDADARSAVIGGVTLTSPSLFMERDASGAMRSTRIVKQRADVPGDQQQPRPGPADVAELQAIEYPLQQAVAALRLLASDLLGPWSLEVEQVQVEDGAVSFKDLSVRRPVAIQASQVELTAGPLRSEGGFRLPLRLALAVEGGGAVELAGEASLDPRRLDLDVTTDALALSALGPYLPAALPGPLPPAELREANLFLDGHLAAARSDDGSMETSWSGDWRIEQLQAEQTDGPAPLTAIGSIAVGGETSLQIDAAGAMVATWQGTTEARELELQLPMAGTVETAIGALTARGAVRLAVPADGGAADVSYQGDVELRDGRAGTPGLANAEYAMATATAEGVDLSSSQRALRIERVAIQGPSIRAEPALLPRADAESDAGEALPAGEPAAEPGFTIALGQLEIDGGSFELRDDAAQPPAVILGQELSVRASNLATDGQTVADVEVTSSLQGSGRIRLGGRMNAFGGQPAGEVELGVTGLPLEPFNAFAGRYVGHLVESGRLTMTMPLTVDQGSVSGSLDLQFDRLYLGEAVESPDAPDVPVKLGLDLLRDASEQITATIPLSGDMADPDFSIGGLVWNAFMGLLLKSATAPFQIIGAVFGGGADQDLSFADFEPGTADLTGAALSKLDVLARALDERPALRLSVAGRIGAEQDLPALQRQMLREQMLERIQRTRPAIQSLSEDDYRTAVRSAYREAVPEAEPPEALEPMEEALADRIEVPPARLAELAARRAEAVVKVLVEDDGADAQRIEIMSSEGDQLAAKSPRADFQLQ
jgi:hypothetical protein